MARRKPGTAWRPSRAQILSQMPRPFRGFASVKEGEAVLVSRPGWKIILKRRKDWDPWHPVKLLHQLVDAEGPWGDVYGCGADLYAAATWDPARHLRDLDELLCGMPDPSE